MKLVITDKHNSQCEVWCLSTRETGIC